MIVLSVLCTLGMVASLIGLLETVTPAYADIEEGAFDIQGWWKLGLIASNSRDSTASKAPTCLTEA